MALDLTGPMVTVLQGDLIHHIILVRMDFPTSVERLHNGVGSYTVDIGFGSETYVGIGDIGRIRRKDEGSQVRSYRAEYVLTGDPNRIIPLGRAADYQQRDIDEAIIIFDENDEVIIGPEILWSGRMSHISTRHTAIEAAVILTATNRMDDWDRPRLRRNSFRDQREDHPGDSFWDQLAVNRKRRVLWGGERVGGSGGSRGSTRDSGEHDVRLP